MENIVSFIVYNASAGSGKTYTLVRDFLAILLKNKDPFYFKHVLAITFTNKASAEMKQRILENLQSFVSEDISDMKLELMKETGLDPKSISTRSKAILEAMLQDYSDLNVTTIDSFTHRIIRSFAFDFGLTSDFNVELDAEKILKEAVDNVISQIGIDKELTKALVEFSVQKSNEDKSWDISKNLFEFSKILLNETHKAEFLDVADKNFEDYQNLQQQLILRIKSIEKRMQQIGERGLEIIEDFGIEHSDFLRGAFPKHFWGLSKDWEQAKFFDESALRNNIEENKFYPQNKSADIKARIENALPELLNLYSESEQLYSALILDKMCYDGLFPMAILSYILKAMEQLKRDYNIQLISDFNEMIQQKIQSEPAAFIYERLGEKFRHYFIDEMQDTSVLQWKNLISLIENALSQEGSLLLVGDPKQSIYRWRGSNPEQFISLSDANQNKPFHTEKKIVNLDTNYRSFTEIIDFNNSFFTHISDLLNRKDYSILYKDGVFQKQNSQKGGYVQLDFIKKIKEDEDDKSLIYPKKVLETIQNLDKDFKWKDICVLVRKNNQGAAVAQYLIENGIDVLSSESLLLSQNERIVFLVNALQILYNPKDLESRYNVLDFLYRHLEISTTKHEFFDAFIHLSSTDFYSQLNKYDIDIQEHPFYQKSLYDSIEYLIRGFQLNEKSNIYLQFFLDFALEFQIQDGSDLGGFLEHWENKKDKLSISIPEEKNAVRIMTIHKAKGLQFPVVIFPYDLSIYETRFEKSWYKFETPNDFCGFKKVLITHNKTLQYTDNEGFRLYNELREQNELDNINLLYVVLTRAVEQLYILTDYGLDAKNIPKTNYFSGLFTRYLTSLKLWQNDQLQYSFGSNKKVEETGKKTQETKPVVSIFENFISSDPSSHRLLFHTRKSLLWDTEQGKAIDYGNLLHEMLAEINTTDDAHLVLNQYVGNGLIANEEIEKITHKIDKILHHKLLKKYFETNHKVLCEREIYTTDGQIHIPDRLVFFDEKRVGILDYKTGLPKIEHRDQIELYAKIIAEMGYEVIEKYLVYISDEIKVKGEN